MARSKYVVKLKKAPKGHVVPPLVSAFGEWLSTQQYGSVGSPSI